MFGGQLLLLDRIISTHALCIGNMGHSNNHLIMDMISTHTLRTEGGKHGIHADANHHPISIHAPLSGSDQGFAVLPAGPIMVQPARLSGAKARPMRESGLFHQRFGDLFPKERDLREFPLVVVQVVLGQDAAGVVIRHGPDSHALEKPVDAGQDLLALPRVLAGTQGDADPPLAHGKRRVRLVRRAVRRAAVDERLELAGDPAPIVRGRDGDQVRLFHLFQNQLYVVVLHAFRRLIAAPAPLAEGIMQIAQAERLRFHPFFLKCVPDQFQQPGRVPVVLGARIEQQSLQFDISSIQSSSPFPRAAPAGGKSFP